MNISDIYDQYELEAFGFNRGEAAQELNRNSEGGLAFRKKDFFMLKYPHTVGASSTGKFTNYNSNQSSIHAKNMAKNHIDESAVEPYVFFNFMTILPKDKYEANKDFYDRRNKSGGNAMKLAPKERENAIKKVQYALIGDSAKTQTVTDGETETTISPGDTVESAISEASEKGFMKPVLRHQSGSIAMYMPTDIQINDSVVYNEKSRKTFGIMEGMRDIEADSANSFLIAGGLTGLGTLIGFGAEKVAGSAKNAFGKFIGDKGTEAGGFLGAAGASVVLDEYQRSSGKATNPHDYMAYENTSLRTFSYTFTFLPDSKQESDEVTKIIKEFRYAAHAERIDALKLHVPDHVVVTHHGAGKMIQLPPCVIESVNVTYNPNNTSFFMEGNNPVEVGLSITLKEIVPIYKHDVEAGF